VHTDLLFHGIVGAVLLAMSVVVLVLTARSWRRTTVLPLPAALIVFALLVDASIAIGRVSLGTGRGTAVRYTMFNLLIPIALLITLFVIQEAKTYPTFSIVGAAVAIVVVLQAAMSTTVGFQEAGAWRARILTGNSIVVDLDRIPQPERTGVFNGYVFPSLQAVTALGWLTMVDQDRLGELSK
jgi:hypothetical protein